METALYVLIALLGAGVAAFAAVIFYGLAENKGKKTRISIAALAAVAAAVVIVIIFCAIFLPHYWRGLNVESKDITKRMLKVIAALVTALLIVAAAVLILFFRGKTEKNRYFTSRNITRLAVFTAISYILYMFVKFNLTIFPSFLDIQISDMPALLAGFTMGPVSGVIVIVLKVLLKLPFSSTGCVGELADLLVGIAFVLPAALVYRTKKTKKMALLGLAAGTVCCIFVAILANWLILIPFLSNLYGGFKNIVKSVSLLYKGVTEENFYSFYLWIGVLPFNALRCFISALVTFLIYSRTEKIFISMFADINKPKACAVKTAENIEPEHIEPEHIEPVEFIEPIETAEINEVKIQNETTN